MKIKQLVSLGLLATGLCFSCEKQGPTPDCLYPPCEEIYEDIRKKYQEEANRNCTPLFFDFTCCDDNEEVDVLFIVWPQSPPCPSDANTEHT